MKIAIVVPGRFYAFELGSALLELGEDVTIFTNYPKSIVARFGFPAARVRSLVSHGVAIRLALQLGRVGRTGSMAGEAGLHRWFGSWAASMLPKERWDVILCFSGVAEEILSHRPRLADLILLTRASAHIEEQSRLLEDERKRTASDLQGPTRWMIDRELREYQLADRIIVLSTFALRSFLERGSVPARVRMLPLAVDPRRFSAPERKRAERSERIKHGRPIHVLYVGALTYRKGFYDAAQVVKKLEGPEFEFRFVGFISPEVREQVRALGGKAEFIGKVPEESLPEHYGWGDVFLFPTIEDGFPLVLTQALAAGLPLIATRNSSAADLISEGVNGWSVSARDSEAMADRLRWCAENRQEFAAVTRGTGERAMLRGWDQVASDFQVLCNERLGG